MYNLHYVYCGIHRNCFTMPVVSSLPYIAKMATIEVGDIQRFTLNFSHNAFCRN